MTQNSGSAVPPRSGAETQVRRQRVRTSLLLLLLGAVFFVWWSQPPYARASRSQPRWTQYPAQARTEEQWVVGEIGNAIAEMVAFARTRKSAELAGLQSEVHSNAQAKEYLVEMQLGEQAPPVQTRLWIVDHLWSPGNFSDLTSQLLRDWGQGAVGIRSPVDRDMVFRLTNPTPDGLIREDIRLSEALTKFPLDAELHEEAALLLGSFALRHSADCFYDVRGELCRMTAHLALARGLSANGGPCGDLADAILNTLIGRQAIALGILRRLEVTADTGAGLPGEAAAVWIRALTMRNTGDYRKFNPPKSVALLERRGSLLEELEYVRALRSSVDSTAASKFLHGFLRGNGPQDDERPEMLAEWGEIILSGPFSVGEGHAWTGSSLQLEYREIAAAYHQYCDKKLEKDQWSEALNAMTAHVVQDGPEAKLEVFGWSSWAEMRQRQLCDVIRKTWDFLDKIYGDHDEAKEFKTEMTENFSKLRLFPMVDMEGSDDVINYRAYQARVRALAEEHPDWVPFAIWPDYHADPPPRRKPHANSLTPVRSTTTTTTTTTPANPAPATQKWTWFEPHFPTGTLYDLEARQRSGLNSGKGFEQTRIMAPYNDHVLYYATIGCTPEEREAQYAMISEYNMSAMRAIANSWQNNPDKYETAFSAVCRLNPDSYIELGKYLEKHDRKEAAARAYQTAVDQATDRVYVSNNVCWLAHYYYDNGRKDDAFKVARMAANVYSSAGLDTMAAILECDGKLREAASYREKIAERYGQWGGLAIFYNKHRNDDPEFAAGFDRATRKVFPQGQESIDVTSLSTPPTDGVMLTGMSPITSQAGLKPGHVMVSVNGVRISNSKQYFYMMDTASSPKTEIGFWSGENYRTVVLDLPKHRIGGAISDFHQ